LGGELDTATVLREFSKAHPDPGHTPKKILFHSPTKSSQNTYSQTQPTPQFVSTPAHAIFDQARAEGFTLLAGHFHF
jgi:hypothetical protein